MFYLIQTNLGVRRCVNKSLQDIYTNNMNIGCGQSLPFPSNIQFVKKNKIRCTGTPNSINAEVFCDFITATRLNLV
jgi:hypothetical protein